MTGTYCTSAGGLQEGDVDSLKGELSLCQAPSFLFLLQFATLVPAANDFLKTVRASVHRSTVYNSQDMEAT